MVVVICGAGAAGVAVSFAAGVVVVAAAGVVVAAVEAGAAVSFLASGVLGGVVAAFVVLGASVKLSLVFLEGKHILNADGMMGRTGGCREEEEEIGECVRECVEERIPFDQGFTCWLVFDPDVLRGKRV
jgi:hypothetical protein